MIATSKHSSALAQLCDDAAERLQQLKAQGLHRQITVLEAIRGAEVTIDGKRFISWCSNDYLGLSQHPEVIQAAAGAAQKAGVGARASRLLAGTTRWHEQLEEDLARWYSAESAIVYPSGYQANCGALGALAKAEDIIFTDRLAHASLCDAARATRATFRVFRHNDLEHLKLLLSRSTKARRRFIVTEGVFSMDGDRAPLSGLLDLAEAHDAVVYLDDAHGAFVTGKTGRGSIEENGVAADRLVYMATLGKALGCQGGFVAGSSTLIDLLRNKSRTFIYSTALAIPVAAAAIAALKIVQARPGLRKQVEANCRAIHQALIQSRIPTSAMPSHILPVILGDTAQAVRCAGRLYQQGIWAPAIRPPTVPKNTARLRLGITALHTEEQVGQLIEALEAAWADR